MVWEEKTLRELSKKKDAIVSGPFGSNLKVVHYKDKGIPILRLQNIGKGFFIDKDIKFISEEKAQELKYHSFVSGDLVLAKLGVPIGKTCRVPDKFKRGIIVADVVRIRPDKTLVDYDFLGYYLNTHLAVSQLTENISGATRPRVNLSDVRDITINLPPIEVQKRIVAILDKAFENIEKAKTKAEKNQSNAKELFESYLQRVFENKGEDWEEKKLGNVCEIKPPKSEARNKLQKTDTVSFLPMHDLGINQKDVIPTKKRKLKDVEGSYTYFAEGDVLLAKITPCFENGKLGIAKNLTNGIGFGSSEYIVFRTHKELIPSYLYYFLLRSQFRREGAKRMKGAVGHKRVSKEFVEDSGILLPSLKEQKRIVAKLDSLEKETSRLGEIYTQKLTDLEELKQSILHKAFKGKLTEVSS